MGPGVLAALAPPALPSSDTPKANPGLGPEASPVGPPLQSSPPRLPCPHTSVGVEVAYEHSPTIPRWWGSAVQWHLEATETRRRGQEGP